MLILWDRNPVKLGCPAKLKITLSTLTHALKEGKLNIHGMSLLYVIIKLALVYLTINLFHVKRSAKKGKFSRMINVIIAQAILTFLTLNVYLVMV